MDYEKCWKELEKLVSFDNINLDNKICSLDPIDVSWSINPFRLRDAMQDIRYNNSNHDDPCPCESGKNYGNCCQ